ncbi:MAG: peptidase [Nitrosarchaeum sp.]|nr:peptidase [Nitrosarchaeum sp.]
MFKICIRKQNKYFKRISLSVISILIFFTVADVHGHGVGSEIFPPVDLNGKKVSLEVSSSTNNPDENDDQQISISLIDFNSKITLRDVTFLVKSSHGEQFLFEKEFQSDNGFLVFNFISENTESIQIQEENGNNFFGSLLGLDNRKINVKGPRLSDGGLYKLDVTILTADGYSKKLDVPLTFNAGISIAQTSKHEINHPIFGSQEINVVTYYDEINNFQYDVKSKEITFSMPFEWSLDNINQTSVVHEELIIPKTFGDLLVSGFSMHVNGIKLSDDIVTIDDFFSEKRVVHFIISQKELQNIYNNQSPQNGMNFLIKPNSDDIQLSSVTSNGQFRIFVTWEPENLKSNSKATIYFDVIDVFLKNRPIAVNYDFSVTQNDKIIFKQSGISSDSKEKHNIAEFTIPDNITGIVKLNFQNLADNNLASTSIPIVINNPISNNEILIPDWIRNNAGWWADGQINDSSFVQGVQYLIKERIVKLPPATQNTDNVTNEIPSWIKNNAKWWADGQIDDKTFVLGIQFLIQNKILDV